MRPKSKPLWDAFKDHKIWGSDDQWLLTLIHLNPLSAKIRGQGTAALTIGTKLKDLTPQIDLWTELLDSKRGGIVGIFNLDKALRSDSNMPIDGTVYFIEPFKSAPKLYPFQDERVEYIWAYLLDKRIVWDCISPSRKPTTVVYMLDSNNFLEPILKVVGKSHSS